MLPHQAKHCVCEIGGNNYDYFDEQTVEGLLPSAGASRPPAQEISIKLRCPKKFPINSFQELKNMVRKDANEIEHVRKYPIKELPSALCGTKEEVFKELKEKYKTDEQMVKQIDKVMENVDAKAKCIVFFGVGRGIDHRELTKGPIILNMDDDTVRLASPINNKQNHEGYLLKYFDSDNHFYIEDDFLYSGVYPDSFYYKIPWKKNYPSDGLPAPHETDRFKELYKVIEGEQKAIRQQQTVNYKANPGVNYTTGNLNTNKTVNRAPVYIQPHVQRPPQNNMPIYQPIVLPQKQYVSPNAYNQYVQFISQHTYDQIKNNFERDPLYPPKQPSGKYVAKIYDGLYMHSSQYIYKTSDGHFITNDKATYSNTPKSGEILI